MIGKGANSSVFRPFSLVLQRPAVSPSVAESGPRILEAQGIWRWGQGVSTRPPIRAWVPRRGESFEEINYLLRLRSNEHIWMTFPSCSVDLRPAGCWVSSQSSQASRAGIYALLMALGTRKWLIVTSASLRPTPPEEIIKQ